MKFAAFIVTVAFAGMALFGVFGMHALAGSHGGECIAATAQAIPCPTESNPADSLSFHYESFQKFSQATILKKLLGLLVFAFLAFLSCAYLSALFLAVRSRFLIRRPHFVRARKVSLEWLSLHENSPSYI